MQYVMFMKFTEKYTGIDWRETDKLIGKKEFFKKILVMKLVPWQKESSLYL